MRLSAGDQLGPYEILAPIGAGGMGEVYRARDTKLQRDVAVKVLPDAFAGDPARMARFEREARVLASLNHPHIAAIYGVEDRALVMEFVDGASPRGPLAWEEAWKIGSQIAAALEYAHEKGVVHRDLKPANLKVTADGQVKVLDFGLAKALTEPDTPQASGADSPTLTMRETLAGVILGTAGYMAPEQARGKAVDKRADIWSFGVVLYELLTGRQLFEGETVSDTLAQVLTKEPDWDRVPAPACALLRRCLERDPKLRLRDAGDARLLIESEPFNARRRPSKVLATVAAACVLTAAVSAWGWWRGSRPVEQSLQPLTRLDVDLGTDIALGSLRGAAVSLSPDATRLVYVSRNRLFTRRLDEPRVTELAGTEGAYAPFFSPDGRWVAFFTLSKLKKVSLDGSAAIDLCTSAYGLGGTWGEDGNIIAGLNLSRPLQRLPAAGGVPIAITELAQGEVQRWPQILPGGKAVLFTSIGRTSIGRTTTPSIEVLVLKDRRRKTLMQGSDGRYLPAAAGAGYLLYVDRNTLFAVPFDPDRLEIHGTPVPIVQEVAYSGYWSSAQFAFARNGTLVYRSGTGGGLLTVAWLDSSGNVEPLLGKAADYARPRLSPDGRRIALEINDGSQSDLWVYDLQRETMTRLSFGGARNVSAIWTPDGRHLVFSTLGGMLGTDGAGKTQPFTQSQNLQFPSAFSPDGKWMAFYENSPDTARDLWVVPVEEDGAGLRAGKPEIFLQTPFDERNPAVSPDGRWIAYVSDESGRYEVYVRAFTRRPAGSGGKWQVSNSGGDNPEWSRNGRELFFHGLDDRIMVAAYTAKADSFTPDKPRAWSQKPLANTGTLRNYDLAPDGKRVLALLPAEGPDGQSSPHHVIFLMNFLDELRRRVPLEK